MGFKFYIMSDKILCFYHHNLVLVPFEDAESGYYPVYEKAEIIKEDVPINNRDYGILIDGDGFNLVESTWDGFQPVYDLDVFEIMKIMSEIMGMVGA